MNKRIVFVVLICSAIGCLLADWIRPSQAEDVCVWGRDGFLVAWGGVSNSPAYTYYRGPWMLKSETEVVSIDPRPLWKQILFPGKSRYYYVISYDGFELQEFSSDLTGNHFEIYELKDLPNGIHLLLLEGRKKAEACPRMQMPTKLQYTAGLLEE